MDILNSYFQNLIFTHVDEKENFSIYAACISSGLGGGKKRYVFLFVPKILTFKKKAYIHELNWKNLQTREISYSYKLRPQHWVIPREAIDPMVEVVDRNEKHTTYKLCEYHNPSLEILLIHNPKKKTIFQYRNKMTLTAVVDMFNSIINIQEEIIPYNGNNYFDKVKYFNEPSVQNWFHFDSGVVDDSYRLI